MCLDDPRPSCLLGEVARVLCDFLLLQLMTDLRGRRDEFSPEEKWSLPDIVWLCPGCEEGASRERALRAPTLQTQSAILWVAARPPHALITHARETHGGDSHGHSWEALFTGLENHRFFAHARFHEAPRHDPMAVGA